jgi:hypothetical protein
MAHRTNRFAIVVVMLGAAAAPAMAQNYDDLSRSDFISLSAGNAKRSNTAIQTPTPWPPYVNNVRIPGYGERGVLAIEQLNSRYAPQQAAPQTVINIGNGSDTAK